MDKNEFKLLADVIVLLEKLLRQQDELKRLIQRDICIDEEILSLVQPPPQLSQHAGFTFSTGASKMPFSVTLAVGQTSTLSPITFLADGVTPSGATYSALTTIFSDPSSTVVVSADSTTALVTGVAAGTASGTGSFTATDTD